MLHPPMLLGMGFPKETSLFQLWLQNLHLDIPTPPPPLSKWEEVGRGWQEAEPVFSCSFSPPRLCKSQFSLRCTNPTEMHLETSVTIKDLVEPPRSRLKGAHFWGSRPFIGSLVGAE